MTPALAEHTTVEIAGRILPALAVRGPLPAYVNWWALVPLENGWVASVVIYPERPEYSVGLMTPAEAAEGIAEYRRGGPSPRFHRLAADTGRPRRVFPGDDGSRCIAALEEYAALPSPAAP